MKKILAILIIVFSFLPYCFAARVWEVENKTAISGVLEEYTIALKNYRSYRQEYLAILNKNRSKDCNSGNSDCEEEKEALEEKAVDYINGAREVMEKYIKSFRLRIENHSCGEEKNVMLSDSGKWIAWLSDKESQIENLESEEISELSSELSSFWRSRELKFTQYRGELMVCRISSISQSLDSILEEIDAYILETEIDYETEKVKSKFLAIKNKYKDALAKKEEAQKIFKDLTLSSLASFSQGQDKIEESSALIQEVYQELRNFLKDLTKASLSPKEKIESDQVLIRGEGFLSIEGRIFLEGKIGNDTFPGTIKFNNLENLIEIDVLEDASRVTLTDGAVEYRGVKDISFSGSNLVVEISSEFIDLLISGEGKLSMTGEALYKASENFWTDIPKEGININF